MSVFKKKLIVTVTKSDGTYLGTWDYFSFDGFSKALNAGLGDCQLTLLDKQFDYGGNDLVEGNIIELRLADKDTVVNTPEPTILIYKGYISYIERSITGAKETVKVQLLGVYTKLAFDILKNSLQTTLYSKATDGLTITSGSQSPADVADMVKAVIDRYIVENSSSEIRYYASDVPATGTVVEYAFEQKTYREALDKLKELAPPGVYWYIGADGLLKFKDFSTTTPKHRFIFGRHFNAVNVQKSLEKVRNSILIWNGEPTTGIVYKHYENAGSIALYGRRSERLNDYGIDNTAAADAIAAKFLNETANPELKVICTILDNNGSQDDTEGYDIESIEPGDTCSFYGFNTDLQDIFKENMLITNVDYKLDYVEIEVQVVKSGLQDFLDRQGKNLLEIGSGGLKIPESYT